MPWEGLLIEYFAKLAASSYPGLSSPSWVLTWTSASSRAQHASSWTAAVNDVALGIADIGCSLFWMTAERLEMSSVTANLLSDQFYLFVPKPKVDDSLLTKIKQPFMPFTLGVWLVVILIILATGALRSGLLPGYGGTIGQHESTGLDLSTLAILLLTREFRTGSVAV